MHVSQQSLYLMNGTRRLLNRFDPLFRLLQAHTCSIDSLPNIVFEIGFYGN